LFDPYDLLQAEPGEKTSSVEPASSPLPEPGEGDELRRFMEETGHSRLEVWDAVDRYLGKIPAAIEGQKGSLAIFNVARVLRFGFDLAGNGAWDILCDWNARNAHPPFDTEAEDGPNSLRKKWRDADKSDHQRKPKLRGHLLWSNEVLEQARQARDRRGSSVPMEGWELGAVPLGEFLSQAFPNPERIVGRLLKGTVCMLYGAAGSLKTWLALEIVRQASDANHPVIYVLEEGLPHKVQERMKQMRIASEQVFIAMRRGFILHEPRMLDSLISRAREANAALIVLDPLSNMNEKDENERKEMLEVWNALQRLASETGACVLVLHHSSKMGSRQGRMDMGADMSNLRGSSVLQGAVDLMLELRRDPDNLRRAEVTTTKNRNEAMEVPGSVELMIDPADPSRIAVNWVHGEEALKQHEDRKAAKAAKKERQDEEREELDKAILNVVRDSPGGSKSGVIKGLSRCYSQSTIGRRIDALLRDRILVNRSPPPNYALYLRGEGQSAPE
jgi:KaiC/GvpD/RAD55 family RecA-like ATPase